MKKIVYGLSTLLLCFMMVSCGNSGNNAENGTKEDNPISNSASKTENGAKEDNPISNSASKTENGAKEDNPIGNSTSIAESKHVSELKSIIEDIEKNGSGWTEVEQWDVFIVKMSNCIIGFAESEPSKEEYENFKKVYMECQLAMMKVGKGKVKEALAEASTYFKMNHKDLDENVDKAMFKLHEMDKEFK